MPKKNKTFEILVKCFTTVVVEAEDEERALQIADEVIMLRGVELDEVSIDRTLKTQEEITAAVRGSEWHRHDSSKSPYTEEY